MVGSAVRLQARKTGATVAVGATAEGKRSHARRVSVAGSIGVARAGGAGGSSAKLRRLGEARPPAPGSSTPSLAELARLAARSGGLVRPPPPPGDPVTQPEL